jgi:GT2 family glycosyltransferase
VDRVLTALEAQEGVEHEIIVVDNGVVNEETKRVVEKHREKFPAIVYLEYRELLGYAGAVNAGVAHARTRLVANINNDNIPDSNWLAELVREYESAARAGKEAIVTSLVHRPDFPEPLAARMNIWGRIVRPRGGAEESRIFHPDGSAFLFSKEAFGLPYDPDYFIYHEDVSFGWRAWLTGREVRMAARSRAETFDGGTTRRIAYRTAYFTERNRWLNYFVFLSAGSLARLLPFLILDYLFKLIAGSNRRAKLHALAWILTHPTSVGAKRRAMQAGRRRADREILPLLSGTYLSGSGLGARLANGLARAWMRIVRLPLGN